MVELEGLINESGGLLYDFISDLGGMEVNEVDVVMIVVVVNVDVFFGDERCWITIFRAASSSSSSFTVSIALNNEEIPEDTVEIWNVSKKSCSIALVLNWARWGSNKLGVIGTIVDPFNGIPPIGVSNANVGLKRPVSSGDWMETGSFFRVIFIGEANLMVLFNSSLFKCTCEAGFPWIGCLVMMKGNEKRWLERIAERSLTMEWSMMMIHS